MNTYSELHDGQLAQLARQDADAFDVLYRRHVTPVYRYCYTRTDNVAEAEDLTAQTFLAALESIGRYRGRASFAAWLFGIARRKCADHYRQHYADRSDAMADDTLMPDPDTQDPEEALFRDGVLDCVESMLPHVSPDRLEALRLRFWGGLSMQEVAKVMQRSESAVKMLVSRAISDLRERCLNGQVSG